MKNYIVNELIAAMKERIPRGINLANYLTDALCMGKEAVYRRLRGEVAFTFDEIAMISCKLGISIDQIIGNHQSNRVTFDLNLLHSPDPLESYYEIIERYLRIFNYVKDDISTKIYTASNVILSPSILRTNTYQSLPVQMDLSKWKNTYPKQLIGNAHTGQSGPCP